MLASTSRADEVTPAMRKVDARLQTRVTLRSPRILVGELLERLSKQSGVTLTADAWSTAGSDSVAVSLRDVPLADAMDALWSLFSYRHMEWDWRRSTVKGAGGKYAYNLARPDYARFQAERLKEQVQAGFEAQAKELLDALDMPPDQLKQAAEHDFLLHSLLVDGRVGPGMRVLASLPPETLLNLLRNHQSLSISVSELSPEAQKALRQAWDWEVAAAAKQGFPKSALLPEATHIGISVDFRPDLMVPALYIEAGRGGGQYFGGAWMEDAWRKKMNAGWMQSGEATTDPATTRTLAISKPPPSAADQPHALADYLLQFSDAAHVSLIARIPHPLDVSADVGMVAQIPMTKTVGAFLEAVHGTSFNLQHKWRGGVLLVTCQNWFVDESEDARLPWTVVQRLRDAEAASDGFLSLNDLAHAAAVLNVAQMRRMGEWFPVMNNAVDWHDFLAFYDKTPEYRPRVLSAKGDDFQYPESLVNPQLGINALRVTHPNLRLQVREMQNRDRKPPTHEIMFIVRDDDGAHGLNGKGFGYAAHEYQTSLKVDEGTPAGGQKK